MADKKKADETYVVGERVKVFTAFGENVRATILEVQHVGNYGAIVYKVRQDSGRESYHTAAYLNKTEQGN